MSDEPGRPASPQQMWFTVPETATYLRCSDRHIRHLKDLRELTPRKVAGRWIFHRDELDAYANAQPSA